MFVKYSGMSSPNTSNLRRELATARALFVCGARGETTAQLAHDHQSAATVTAKRHHGNWQVVDAPDLGEVLVARCGMKWFPSASVNMRIHESQCKSCQRIRANQEAKVEEFVTQHTNALEDIFGPIAPAPAIVVEAAPPTEHANGTFGTAIDQLHTLSSAALDLAGHCDEAAMALESLADYDSQMITLRDNYQAALATASGVLHHMNTVS